MIHIFSKLSLFRSNEPNVANIVKTNSFLSDRQSSDAVRRGLGFSHSVIIRDRLCKCNPQTQSLTRAFYAIFECQRPLSAQRCSARIKALMSIPLKCCEQLAAENESNVCKSERTPVRKCYTAKRFSGPRGLATLACSNTKPTSPTLKHATKPFCSQVPQNLNQ